ncbi:hypothetical protein AB0903_31930, partial [Streptomyces sp. NPDC048389]
MRSARILLASATATAALVITAPGAYALAAADSGKDDSSYSSKDHGKSDKDYDKGGKPHGGMHTGGGALASVSEDHKDWDKDD